MFSFSLPKIALSAGVNFSRFVVEKGEHVQGTDRHDDLQGTIGNDLVEAYGDVDWITWSPGRDIIDGGAGDMDTLSYRDLIGLST